MERGVKRLREAGVSHTKNIPGIMKLPVLFLYHPTHASRFKIKFPLTTFGYEDPWLLELEVHWGRASVP